jgi:hypothetical protein
MSIETHMNRITELSNLIFRKEYDRAISGLQSMLEAVPALSPRDLSMIHINLANALFKHTGLGDRRFELCNHHCIEAMRNGHNTGFAAERLVINLERDGRLQQALEICDIVLDTAYHFDPQGYRQKPDFIRRKEKLLKKLRRLPSKEDVPLLSLSDRAEITENSVKYGF